MAHTFAKNDAPLKLYGAEYETEVLPGFYQPVYIGEGCSGE